MEIMVTLVISTMVILMIYEAMTDQHRSFFKSMKRSDAILESVQIKRKVDRFVSSIDSITTINRVLLEYVDKKDQKHKLHIRSGIIFMDGDSIGGNIQMSQFKLDETDCGTQSLLWDLTFENGYWVGGGRNFN